MAAVAHIGQVAGGGQWAAGSGSVQIDNVLAGSTLVLVVSVWAGTAASPGPDWTLRETVTSEGPARTYIWTRELVPAGSHVVAFTLDTVRQHNALVVELRGLASPGAFDVDVSAQGYVSTLGSGSTAVLAQAESFALAIATQVWNNGATVTGWSNSFSQFGSYGNNTWRMTVARKVTAATTAVSTTASLSGASWLQLAVLVFRSQGDSGPKAADGTGTGRATGAGVAAKVGEVLPQNVDPLATPAAVATLGWLREVGQGLQCVSGQMGVVRRINKWDADVAQIQAETGQTPGLIGVDPFHWTEQDAAGYVAYDYDDTAALAEGIAHWNAGGLVHMCTHRYNPLNGHSGGSAGKPTPYGSPWVSPADAAAMVVPGTWQNTKLNELLDRIAGTLLAFQTAGVAVLYRPYHEWLFWWADYLIPRATLRLLWRYEFTYLTQTKGVHCCIWVYGPKMEVNKLDSDIYPGDDVVDIIGPDTYSPLWETHPFYTRALSEHPTKPFAIMEFGAGQTGGNPSYDQRLMLTYHPRMCVLMNWWTQGSPQWGIAGSLDEGRAWMQDPKVLNLGELDREPTPPTGDEPGSGGAAVEQIVGGTPGNAGSASQSITGVLAGSTLVLVATVYAGTITAGPGGSWSLKETVGPTGEPSRTYIYVLENAAAGSHNPGVTFDATRNHNLQLIELSGVAAASFDVDSSGSGYGSSQSSGTTATLAQADSFAVAVCSMWFNGGATVTAWSNSFTQDDTRGNNTNRLTSASKTLSATTGVSTTPSRTGDTWFSAVWVGVFKAAAAATVKPTSGTGVAVGLGTGVAAKPSDSANSPMARVLAAMGSFTDHNVDTMLAREAALGVTFAAYNWGADIRLDSSTPPQPIEPHAIWQYTSGAGTPSLYWKPYADSGRVAQVTLTVVFTNTWPAPDTEAGRLASIALMDETLSGRWDATYQAIADYLVNNGFEDAVLRIGWEMQNFPPRLWIGPYAETPTMVTKFKACCDRIFNLMQARNPAGRFEHFFCPDLADPSWWVAGGFLESLIGDTVTIVGCDGYDATYGRTAPAKAGGVETATWADPEAAYDALHRDRFSAAISCAKRKGKRFAIGECGLHGGGTGSKWNSGRDNPMWVRLLMEQLAEECPTSGPGQLAYWVYWFSNADTASGPHDFVVSYPNAYAAFLDLVDEIRASGPQTADGTGSGRGTGTGTSTRLVMTAGSGAGSGQGSGVVLRVIKATDGTATAAGTGTGTAAQIGVEGPALRATAGSGGVVGFGYGVGMNVSRIREFPTLRIELLLGDSWIDVSADLLELQYSEGRSNTLDRWTSMEGTLTLRNSHGRYDLRNPDSPYLAHLRDGQLVRVTAEVIGFDYPMAFARTGNWTYQQSGQDAKATVRLQGGISRLASTNLAGTNAEDLADDLEAVVATINATAQAAGDLAALVPAVEAYHDNVDPWTGAPQLVTTAAAALVAGDAVNAAQALTAAAVLVRGPMGVGELADSRITRLLDAAGWPDDLRRLSTQNTVPLAGMTLSGDAWGQIDQVVLAEYPGVAYIAPDGAFVYLSGDDVFSLERCVTSQFTCGARLGEDELRLAGPEPQAELNWDAVRTRAEVTRPGSDTVVRYVNHDAETAYAMSRTMAVEVPVLDDVALEYVAGALIALRSDPRPVVSTITLDLTDKRWWPICLSIEPMTRFTVIARLPRARTPGRGIEPVEAPVEVFFEGREVRVSRAAQRWDISWRVSEASAYGRPWTADHPTLEVIEGDGTDEYPITYYL